jgi:eukaryotic-like serine/threonine-protein kinase
MLTAALVAVSVGVAAAFVVGSRDSVQDEVWNLYLGGRRAEVNRNLVGLQTAAQHYRGAIERDSGFALGYAALSQTYGHMAFYDFAPKAAALDSARILALRAMELDSMVPETRTALALSLGNSGHYPAAEREFRRAIELDPNNAEAHSGYGMLLVALGRGEEALTEAELALKLDPLAPRVTHSVRNQATYLTTGERPQLRLPFGDRRPVTKVQPGEPWARAQTAVELADEKRCADARSEISLAQRLVQDDNMPMLAFVGAIHWSCGEPEHARALLAQMKQHLDAQDHALRVAILRTELGEPDSAFVWLKHHRWMLAEVCMLRAAPRLDPLRSDPAFPQLLVRLGLR